MEKQKCNKKNIEKTSKQQNNKRKIIHQKTTKIHRIMIERYFNLTTDKNAQRKIKKLINET